MIFFGIIADTAADLRKKEKRKKKRKERNNFENCGDDDCAEEWNFFHVFIVPFEFRKWRRRDRGEMTAWRMRILYIGFFFSQIGGRVGDNFKKNHRRFF